MTTSGNETIWLTDGSAKTWRGLPSGKAARTRRLKEMRIDVETALGPTRRRLREIFSEGLEGMLLWLNLTGRTYDPRLRDKHPPFHTWPIQEEAAAAIWRSVAEGGDLLIDKSRDMGATWLSLAVFFWWWLFVPDTPLLVASRKAEYVDNSGNPDTLFWKLDYLLKNQPAWLRPRAERRHMHLGNLAGGGVIDGESTNADLGRGGRRKAILLDEFAAVENGAEILAATADAAPCRVFNSTPKGRGNAFADVRFSGKVKVVTLHWKDHPRKGHGARLVGGDWNAVGPEDRKTVGPENRKTMNPASGPTATGLTVSGPTVSGPTATGPTVSGLRWTSPWYEAECARRTSRKEIAQELDIDYLASGDAFFDLDVLQRMRTGAEAAAGPLRPPLVRGELSFHFDTLTEGVSYRLSRLQWRPEGGKRRLSLWCPVVTAKRSEGGRDRAGGCPDQGGTVLAAGDAAAPDARPRQDRNYVAFCDVAHGTGASNSVIKVADASTREEVASFVCPDTAPHELARYAVALCEWFGGRRRCLLGWEANGPGGIFGLEVSRMGYRAVLGNPSLGAPWRPEDGVGWQSSREKKLDLLGDLRRALARGELVLHDEATVAELEQYIYYPSGAVGPSGLVQEVEGARAAHGDRVIAAAGLLLCLAQQPGPGASGGAPPAGSFENRRQEHRRKSDDSGRWATD